MKEARPVTSRNISKHLIILVANTRRLGNEVEDERLRTYLHHQLCKLFIVLATVLHGFNAGVQGGGEIGHQDTVPLN